MEEKSNVININAGATDSTSSVEISKTTGKTKLKVKIYGDPDEANTKAQSIYNELIVNYPDEAV